MWHDERITKMLGIRKPLLLAPMAGSGGSALAISVMKAGGLGSLPCAMLSPDQIRQEISTIRAAVSGPINLNFFCHREPKADIGLERQWLARLTPYYRELDIQLPEEISGAGRNPFNEEACALVEELKPEVVSFHFGLPDADLLERVFVTGAKVVATATTVTEARELEARGCDAIIAQGVEAGGHRGIFMESPLAAQPDHHGARPTSGGCGFPASHRSRRYWRCPHCGGCLCPWCLCGPVGHCLFALARGTNLAGSPPGARRSERR